MLKPENFSCLNPKLPDAQTRNLDAIKHMRKLLPKGRGLRFDLLTREDCALVMSPVNSEPRGRLAWMTPARVFEAALGGDARALMDAFGVEALGPDALDLTPGCVERARASRGLPPLAG